MGQEDKMQYSDSDYNAAGNHLEIYWFFGQKMYLCIFFNQVNTLKGKQVLCWDTCLSYNTILRRSMKIIFLILIAPGCQLFFFFLTSQWSGQGDETISAQDEWNGDSSDEFGVKGA